MDSPPLDLPLRTRQPPPQRGRPPGLPRPWGHPTRPLTSVRAGIHLDKPLEGAPATPPLAPPGCRHHELVRRVRSTSRATLLQQCTAAGSTPRTPVSPTAPSTRTGSTSADSPLTTRSSAPPGPRSTARARSTPMLRRPRTTREPAASPWARRCAGQLARRRAAALTFGQRPSPGAVLHTPGARPCCPPINAPGQGVRTRIFTRTGEWPGGFSRRQRCWQPPPGRGAPPLRSPGGARFRVGPARARPGPAGRVRRLTGAGAVGLCAGHRLVAFSGFAVHPTSARRCTTSGSACWVDAGPCELARPGRSAPASLVCSPAGQGDPVGAHHPRRGPRRAGGGYRTAGASAGDNSLGTVRRVVFRRPARPAGSSGDRRRPAGRSHHRLPP